MIDNNEKISVYMDGEASEFEAAGIVKQMKQDSALLRCWESYHLIGDAIRNNLSASIPSDFSARLRLAMERESAHSTSHKTPYRRVNDRAGFALAASVSAVAIVGLLQFGQPAMMTAATQHYETDVQSHHLALADTRVQPPVVDNMSAIDMNSQVLAYTSFDGDSLNQVAGSAAQDSVESAVYDYLVDFSQYAVATPLEGSIPAVSLASYRMY
jgi:sigma-E factor negative regulatory protein RseA